MILYASDVGNGPHFFMPSCLRGCFDTGNYHIKRLEGSTYVSQMQKTIDLIRPVAESYAEQQNLKLYDLTLQREKNGRVLRVSLDGDVTLEKCATISRMLSAWLDEQPESLIPYDNYQLEVTSPGIDRPLKTQKDFASQLNKLVRIQTKDKDETGRRNYKGRITEVSDTAVTIYTEEESAQFTINIDNVKKANIEIEL